MTGEVARTASVLPLACVAQDLMISSCAEGGAAECHVQVISRSMSAHFDHPGTHPQLSNPHVI